MGWRSTSNVHFGPNPSVKVLHLHEVVPLFSCENGNGGKDAEIDETQGKCQRFPLEKIYYFRLLTNRLLKTIFDYRIVLIEIFFSSSDNRLVTKIFRLVE